MPFSDEGRAAPMAAEGVGPKAGERVERLGVPASAALAGRDPREVSRAAAVMPGGARRGDGPRARAAVAGAVGAAVRSQERVGTTVALRRRHL
jgi:hypothetical protein